MKQLLILLSIICSLSLHSNSQIYAKSETINSLYSKTLITNISSETTVYICGGQYAEKFHSSSNCSGLNNCKGGIYYYNSQQEAINNGYKYCSICWR